LSIEINPIVMKKLLSLSIILAIISSCSNYESGELTGVSGRQKYFEPEPFGMIFIPQGSFTMGPSDESVDWAQNTMTKTVTVDAFWMDETEITNNEYRQFVHWVRDSIMRRLLGEQIEDYVISEDEYGNVIDPPLLNWDVDIDRRDEEVNEIVQEMYLPQNERFFGRKEIDTRKLVYEYFWIDLQQAAKSGNRYDWETGEYNGYVMNNEGQRIEVTDRSAFVIRDRVLVYPDTLSWISDFTYSYNEPLAKMYFWHPAYDNYPVVGVNWQQASAFCIWRSQLLNASLQSVKRSILCMITGYLLKLNGNMPHAADWIMPCIHGVVSIPETAKVVFLRTLSL